MNQQRLRICEGPQLVLSHVVAAIRVRTLKLNGGLLRVVVGCDAGATGSGSLATSVAIGKDSMKFVNSSISKNVAIGYRTQYTGSASQAVAIGYRAGEKFQAQSSIAIGNDSGRNTKQKYTQIELVKTVHAKGVPLLFASDGTTFLSSPVAGLGIEVIGVDWTIPLKDAIGQLGDKQVIQGNLEPYCLFAPDEVIEKRVRAIVQEGRAAPAHVFSLGMRF